MPTNIFVTNLVQGTTNIPSRVQILDSNLVARLQVLANKVSDPIWLQILNSNLVAALIGFLAAILIWKLTERSQAHQKKGEDQTKYISLLRAIAAELLFYKGKLDGLSKECGNLIEAIQNHRMIIRPSYSLYPRFLERSKQKLCVNCKNEKFIMELAHYHFELCHIIERVEWLKSLRPDELAANLENINGVKALIDENISKFENGSAIFF